MPKCFISTVRDYRSGTYWSVSGKCPSAVVSNLDIGLIRAYHDQHFLEADVSLYCFRLHAYP